MAEITASVIEKAQRKAAKESIRINKALGLPYHVVRRGYLYLIEADGTSKKIKKVVFGLRRIDLNHIKLKDGKYKIQIVRRP
ncbi:MAG: hypothetical protein JJE55_12665 [Flavobacteriaceae bacterium]|nr:hypothetical protein [Flavobacteriaceae bacterium]